MWGFHILKVPWIHGHVQNNKIIFLVAIDVDSLHPSKLEIYLVGVNIIIPQVEEIVHGTQMYNKAEEKLSEPQAGCSHNRNRNPRTRNILA